MPSGLPVSNNDPLSRRDAGLEFLNVTNQLNVQLTNPGVGTQGANVYKITNNNSSVVDTHLLVIVHGLSAGTLLVNASGTTRSGDPYVRVFLLDGVLVPGQTISQSLVFQRSDGGTQVNYTLTLLSGQGNP